VRQLRRLPAAVFAGDRRVWRAALVAAVPVVLLVAVYCVRTRDYYTGTNNVEAYSYFVPTRAGERLCVPGLQIPSGTSRIRLQLISRTRLRPALKLALTLDGTPLPIESRLAPIAVRGNGISGAVFAIPTLSGHPSERSASLCLTAAEAVSWGGTPLPSAPSSDPPTAGGFPVAGRIAVRYLPRAGAQRSYLAQAGAILRRASLFRPGLVGPWLYVVILLVVLPGLALASVRCLALAAAAGRMKIGDRRLAGWLFAIAALNFVCWALITPTFQAPDEVDHFAYTQSLVERGQAPSRNPASPLRRWSSAETLALDDMGFFTDHQVGDTRAPWTARQQARYRAQAAFLHPSASDGGGNETAATHGPIYYALLAPAYVLASSSPISQLTLMRIVSALIGALTALFTFLLARELAPGRAWLAALAALLVAYQPMFGFISGSVNNDVGVNAGAAALELLLIRVLRRGVTLPSGLLTGGLLALLPIVKGTAYELYPVAAVALLLALSRHHRRTEAPGWAGVALGGIGVRELSVHLAGVLQTSQGNTPGTGAGVSVTSTALAHPTSYLGYLWQVFLPRLSFMAPHFQSADLPAFVIFVERGWGAFGWYDVFFPEWVYLVILVTLLLFGVMAVVSARREWPFVRRHLAEAAIIVLIPVAVVAGFEAAFYTPGKRAVIAEFGRYTFPAVGPLAVLAVASLHALGRRWLIQAGTGLLVAMLGLSYASQLLTMTAFYA
jgi:hypothetical protein